MKCPLCGREIWYQDWLNRASALDGVNYVAYCDDCRIAWTQAEIDNPAVAKANIE